MQQFHKLIGSIVLVILLFSYTLTPVLAKEKGKVSSKDEVIYAMLEANGSRDEAFVVNLLNVSKAGIVKDYGDYASVKNLTGLHDITQKDNQIEVEAEKGKLYYQGNLDDADLPWEFSLEYRLDGKKVDPKALIGESGKLQIDIDVKQNKNANKVFFENYLLQIALPFDAERTDDLKAKDAVIANAGKDELVTFTAMPDEEAMFTVTADVAEFEMEGIEISGVPSTMSIDTPDTDDMTSDIKTLADAIADVNDGVAELKQGISELSQGSSELASGSDEYMAGIEELNGSSAELVSGSGEMNEALQTLNNELQKIEDIDLDVLQELQAGVANVTDGFDEAKKGLQELRKNHAAAYDSLEDAMEKIPADDISEADIKALYESDADEETINTLVATYKAAQETKKVFANVKQGFEIVDDTLAAIIEQVEEAAQHMDQFKQEIGGSLDEVEIDEELSELTSGINQMAVNYQIFHNGLIDYTEGVSSLSSNYEQLNEGMIELSKGTDELEAGASELHRGTDKLTRSTSNLPEEMTKEIDKMIDEYDKSDFEPVSFVEADKNEDVFSVQFVMKTESLEKEEVEKEVEEEEEKGFWEKFLDLFR